MSLLIHATLRIVMTIHGQRKGTKDIFHHRIEASKIPEVNNTELRSVKEIELHLKQSNLLTGSLTVLLLSSLTADRSQDVIAENQEPGTESWKRKGCRNALQEREI
ncbi:uncharacterized protein LOC131044509 isoform X1 [Cryptomeria japonica]|uniref:uncharacterized protein LOC131044509 isoform X1 n=1 Tax=Cryptomeria japonica TaxID=3369 RepID=UPI0025ABE6A1|nr:uncharacterized protein LOC131044509 isoform X1 [Cryptomeria japonica]